ncbi:MAG: response regulator transcription factor [Asticcacaulis sp.]|uniref:response regulator transcription factor n=1 Tax=Asticcacaulis sp. TaxID=1872648 RepID=UPI003F7C8D8E
MMTDKQGVEALTARQREILRLISQHMQAKEIARALDISERTVKTHTDAARKRLGVTTSREAARLLMAHEGAAPLVRQGRWPSGTIDPSVKDAAGSQHDPELHPDRRDDQRPAAALSDPLAGSGIGVAHVDGAGQTGPDRRYAGDSAGLERQHLAGKGGLHPDRSDGLADGRYGGSRSLRQRLESLPPAQWLGVIVLLAVALMIVGTGLLTGAVGTIEAIERIHRQIG